MKKLIIVAALSVMGIVANAATITWSANSISAAPVLTDRSTYMAYLFDSSVSDFDAVCAAIKGNDMSVLSSAIGSKGVSSTGAITLGKGTNTAGEGDFVTVFGIVLNATSPSNASWYLAIDEMTSPKAVSAAGAVSVGFGSQSGVAWAEIAPEPTSGLMMLLGMGVLALRRRRA